MNIKVTIFPFFSKDDTLPVDLLASTIIRFNKIKSGELVDTGLFLYTEIRTYQQHERVELVSATLNGILLKFHPVIDASRLFKAEIGDGLYMEGNFVEVVVKYWDGEKMDVGIFTQQF